MESPRERRSRKYRKSSSPRLRWTSDLHHSFVEAVQNLGGKYKATPKRIMQMMDVRGLKVSHVKSHLQMYRSMKKKSINSIELKCQQLEYINLFSLQELQVCETSRQRKTTQMDGDSLFYYQDKRQEGEIAWTQIMELPNTINLNYQPRHMINLNLTMSSSH